ncbi:hypothetical protein APHAL10511_007160 [Amanita phalloides]|nr:hypothetical protein APHAL10511_007160 [Amanita phalloides]
MSSRPSPNVTPFIPPLSSPNPSPHPPSTPYSAPYTPFSAPGPLGPPGPHPPPPGPPLHPAYAYPPFVSPAAPPHGLSADYAGYPQFLNPTPLTVPTHLPPPHASPWSPPHSTHTTPWQFTAQLPQYPPLPHQFFNAHVTPAMPYAPFSPDPWGIAAHPAHSRHHWPTQPQPPPQPQPQPHPHPHHHQVPSRSAGYSADRLDPFLPGSSYGPVLTPFLVGVVNAQVKLNPLLMPLPDDGGDKLHLKWNMLYTSNYCQRSDDKAHVSWSKGRDAPATFPRITSMRIMSDQLPWTINVIALDPAIGVTCGEVIDTISDCLYRMASGADFNSLQDPRKRAVSESYHYNRSVAADVPGGRLKNGIMRLDFLCKHSMYGGIQSDDQLLKKISGAAFPCVFILRCSKRPVLTESDARQHRERPRSVSRQSAVSNPKSATDPVGH